MKLESLMQFPNKEFQFRILRYDSHCVDKRCIAIALHFQSVVGSAAKFGQGAAFKLKWIQKSPSGLLTKTVFGCLTSFLGNFIGIYKRFLKLSIKLALTRRRFKILDLILQNPSSSNSENEHSFSFCNSFN